MTSPLPAFSGNLLGLENLTVDTYRWLLDTLGLVDLFVDTVSTVNQEINENGKDNEVVGLKRSGERREEKQNVTSSLDQATTVSGYKRKDSFMELGNDKQERERLQYLKKRDNNVNDWVQSLLAQHKIGNFSKHRRKAVYKSARGALPYNDQTSANATTNMGEHTTSIVDAKQNSPPPAITSEDTKHKESSSSLTSRKSGITLKLPGLQQIYDRIQKKRELRAKNSRKKHSSNDKLYKLLMKQLSAMRMELKRLKRQKSKGDAGRNRARTRL